MRKVKEGDTFCIEGVVYRFDLDSAWAYNQWREQIQRGSSPEEEWKGGEIHLFTEDGKSSDFLHPNRIREALEGE